MKTILLAATDQDIIYLLSRYAQACGLQVAEANSSEQTLILAQAIQPAAIVVEIGLPKTIGESLVHELKAQARTQNIPVIVYAWLDDEQERYCEGACGYLTNPVRYQEFVTALESAGVLC